MIVTNPPFTGRDALASLQRKFQFSQRTTLTRGALDVSLLWRHIGSTRFEPQQLQDDLDFARSKPATCPDPEGADPAGCVVDPQFRKVDAYNYFDITTRVRIGERMVWTFSVQNLFDKKPPLLGNDVGSTVFNSGNTYPATYDALGRRYAASATLKF